MERKNILYAAIFIIAMISILGIAYIYGPSSTDQSGNDATETPQNIIIITHGELTWTNTTVKAGTNVTWIVKDFDINHEIISNSTAFPFDSGVLKNGQNYTVNFTQTGTFYYHDKLEPSLNGVVTVQP